MSRGLDYSIAVDALVVMAGSFQALPEARRRQRGRKTGRLGGSRTRGLLFSRQLEGPQRVLRVLHRVGANKQPLFRR